MASTHVVVVRQFSGLQIGEVADTSSWLHTESLIESRHLARLDKDEVAKSLPCAKCKKKWVDADARSAHDCAEDI